MKPSATSPVRILALAIALVVGASSASFAAPKIINKLGGTCQKVNLKVKIGSTDAVCTKVGKKLSWQKSSVSASLPESKVGKPSVEFTLPTAQSAYAIQVKTGSWFFNFTYSLDGIKGVLKSDPAKSKVLFLPVGKLVQIELNNASKEAHGFWIPGLLVDKEILPGNKANLEFTPDKIGTYPGSCNIQCGRGHASMTFGVEVVSEADYLKYLSGLKK